MHCQLHEITPPLRPFVKLICSMDSGPREGPSGPVRVLPDACVELFINFQEGTQLLPPTATAPSRSFITSRLNRFMDVCTLGSGAFLSVCFYPGRAYPFFPVPMTDVANRITDLRELWGRVAAELEERVEQAATPAQGVALVQQYLTERLRACDRLDAAVEFCVGHVNQSNGQLSVEELAGRAGFSNRQLIRRFDRCLGLSPKEFARLRVFLGALERLKNPGSNLTEIAYDSGYYDQAHFIHACRAYSGLSPRQLLATANVLY